jgi:predicted RNA-binding protein (virulence factor B family)
MYLRRHREKIAGEEYGYWSLVEYMRQKGARYLVGIPKDVIHSHLGAALPRSTAERWLWVTSASPTDNKYAKSWCNPLAERFTFNP